MKFTLPSILTYERSINPTDGLLYGLMKKNDETIKVPVLVESRGLMASISDAKNIDKFRKEDNSDNPEAKNLQTIDYAALPVGCHALALTFSVTFVGNSSVPRSFSKDGLEIVDKINEMIAAYKSNNGYSELAHRYLNTIVAGMPLWRNKSTGGRIVTIISCNGQEFEFAGLDSISPSIESDHELVKAVADTLASDGEALRIDVTTTVEKAEGSEVFPSQCYIEGGAGRVLASVNRNGARQGMVHQQKIGNAIRTIDTWYENDAPYAIAVEPYGIDRRKSRATRAVDKTDLYTQLEKHLEGHLEAMTETGDPSSAHYVVACLIRGGVFNKG